MLVCTVRDCRRPLVREARRAVCEHGHSFDVARSGYLNLLQPQDKKSKNPGDTAEAVAARRRLHDLGITKPLLDGIAGMLDAHANQTVLDAGCGEGFFLGSLAERFSLEGYGVDISIPAIDAAARRYPKCDWIVANADRELPYADGSFDRALSITGRMNSGELLRVLKENGLLLVAIPSPRDLMELRGATRDRRERTISEFAGAFRCVDQQRVETAAELDEAGMQDVLLAIYRPLRPESPVAGKVTFSLDVLAFEPIALRGA